MNTTIEYERTSLNIENCGNFPSKAQSIYASGFFCLCLRWVSMPLRMDVIPFIYD